MFMVMLPAFSPRRSIIIPGIPGIPGLGMEILGPSSITTPGSGSRDWGSGTWAFLRSSSQSLKMLNGRAGFPTEKIGGWLVDTRTTTHQGTAIPLDDSGFRDSRLSAFDVLDALVAIVLDSL